MESQLKRDIDGTLMFSIKVPAKDVEKIRAEVTESLAKNVEVSGFRKGKAPKNLAEKNLSKDAVREEMLKRILSDTYAKAVSTHKIKPIVYPRVHVEVFEEGTDLDYTAETCEEPEVTLKNYKDEVKKVTAAPKIILPGKDPSPSTISGSGQGKPNLDEILNAILKTTQITVSKVLIDQEANRLLSQFLDELKTLGMTLEQYLSSRGKTGEALRSEYMQKAENDLKIEFILRKIADTEKITVEKKDIDEALATIKDEKQKQALRENPYLLASLIRQQKTLDFLTRI